MNPATSEGLEDVIFDNDIQKERAFLVKLNVSGQFDDLSVIVLANGFGQAETKITLMLKEEIKQFSGRNTLIPYKGIESIELFPLWKII